MVNWTWILLLSLVAVAALVFLVVWYQGKCLILHGLSIMSGQNYCWAVAVHVYVLNNGMVPVRGRRVIERAAEIARLTHGPLMIVAGYASRLPQLDSECYRQYLVDNHEQLGPLPEIIIGESAHVRTTAEEVEEFARLLKGDGRDKVVVVATLPHLFRVARYWRRFAPSISTRYYGVDVSWPNWPWEILMLAAEVILPHGSWRRDAVLDLFGRRK